MFNLFRWQFLDVIWKEKSFQKILWECILVSIFLPPFLHFSIVLPNEKNKKGNNRRHRKHEKNLIDRRKLFLRAHKFSISSTIISLALITISRTEKARKEVIHDIVHTLRVETSKCDEGGQIFIRMITSRWFLLIWWFFRLMFTVHLKSWKEFQAVRWKEKLWWEPQSKRKNWRVERWFARMIY